MCSLRSCCGRVSLKTGTIIIGSLGLFFNILLLILFWSISSRIDVGSADFLYYRHFKPEIPYGFIVFNLFISGLLIRGAFMRNKWLLLPWITYAALTVITLITIIIALIDGFTNRTNLPAGAFILMIILAGVSGVYIYMIIIVTSHFSELEGINVTSYGENAGKIFSSPNPSHIVLENERVVTM